MKPSQHWTQDELTRAEMVVTVSREGLKSVSPMIFPNHTEAQRYADICLYDGTIAYTIGATHSQIDAAPVLL